MTTLMNTQCFQMHYNQQFETLWMQLYTMNHNLFHCLTDGAYNIVTTFTHTLAINCCKDSW